LNLLAIDRNTFDGLCDAASLAQSREQSGFDASGRFPLAHRRAHLAQRGRKRTLAPESRGAGRTRCSVRVRRLSRGGV
jgi:hypothetical protein